MWPSDSLGKACGTAKMATGLTMQKGSRKNKRKKGGEEGGGGENSPMILRAKSLVNSLCFQSSS